MGHHHHKHALTTTSFTHTKTCRGLKQPLPAITYTLTYAAFKPALTFLKARPMFVAIPQETNPVKKSIHTLRSQHPFTRTPQITVSRQPVCTPPTSTRGKSQLYTENASTLASTYNL